MTRIWTLEVEDHLMITEITVLLFTQNISNYLYPWRTSLTSSIVYPTLRTRTGLKTIYRLMTYAYLPDLKHGSEILTTQADLRTPKQVWFRNVLRCFNDYFTCEAFVPRNFGFVKFTYGLDRLVSLRGSQSPLHSTILDQSLNSSISPVWSSRWFNGMI